ncbi:TRAP transporter small permease [Ornithinimicrobium faecis]|uniref:TRAP transporter small permease n=1 Tax=Ornithinimicrobium faecis TaxID=2934158 RepID=A0ABY4YR03_9MICO|nr:TRAP transporter small permease [Ornithinimicrobium sp. HY1793]USQ79171.1 TRAP transporter small permease [Ornithinimicrobium sp. HY1793]
MKRISNLVANTLLFVAGVLITISTVSLLIQVVSRYFFNAPTVWSEELAIFCFVWSTMLAVPVAFLRREHIVIDFAVNALPKGLQRLVNPLTDLICAVTLGVIGFFAVRLLEAADRQSLSGLTMLFKSTIPLSSLYLAIPVGCALSVVLILYRIVAPIPAPDPVAEAITSAETEV